MATKQVEMTARKRSRCSRCGRWVLPGDRIIWVTSDGSRTGRAQHKECRPAVRGYVVDDDGGFDEGSVVDADSMVTDFGD